MANLKNTQLSVIVKRSKIHSKGLFAARDFKKGETILKWNPKPIKKSELSSLPKRLLHYVEKIGGKFYLQQEPERYMNHSCNPNIKVKGFSDVSVCDIIKGTELTTSYDPSSLVEDLVCRCGSKNCQKVVRSKLNI